MHHTFLILAAGLTVAYAQMTFSDGWGAKRSADFSKHFRTDGNGGGISSPMLDECHTSYSQSLIDLHHKIMVLYENYQECQNQAMAVFQSKHPQQQNN